MITINQLIKLQNNKPDDMIIEGSRRNTKLMFHKLDLKKIDINPHYNFTDFEDYQKEHWNKLFAGTKYILSFWYTGKTAEFIGVYHLGESIIDKVFDEKTKKERNRYRFPKMKQIDFMSDYKNRLYINWTNPSENYARWIEEERYGVHSIKPTKENTIGKLPLNYYDISLKYQKLKKIYEYQIDNEDWKYYLSNRSGVYLILDTSTGEQYIGSAYGEEGFWGRWADYVATGDGGNKKLKNRNFNLFQFSILWETLITTPKNNVIKVETNFKLNLGTRVNHLNNN